MKAVEFCYWLQGYFEIADSKYLDSMTQAQVGLIKAHLALVFKHEIDASYGDQKVQKELNKIHRDGNVRC